MAVAEVRNVTDSCIDFLRDIERCAIHVTFSVADDDLGNIMDSATSSPQERKTNNVIILEVKYVLNLGFEANFGVFELIDCLRNMETLA